MARTHTWWSSGWLLVVAGCAFSSPAGPVITQPAEPMTPPAVYTRWWDEVSACIYRAGDFRQVRWEVVPGEVLVRQRDGLSGSAFYYPGTHVVQLASAWVMHSGIVKHEMAHALLRMPGHEHPVFRAQNTCGVVSSDGGPWQPVLDTVLVE